MIHKNLELKDLNDVNVHACIADAYDRDHVHENSNS
jgi:hypothetical protein